MSREHSAKEVYYDGACPLCRREIAAYRRMPGLQSVVWRDVSDPDFAAEGVDREAALARFHVRRADGEVVSGAKAFLAIWRRSARLAPVARTLDRQPFLAALDLGYAAFLRLRPLWRPRPDAGL